MNIGCCLITIILDILIKTLCKINKLPRWCVNETINVHDIYCMCDTNVIFHYGFYIHCRLFIHDRRHLNLSQYNSSFFNVFKSFLFYLLFEYMWTNNEYWFNRNRYRYRIICCNYFVIFVVGN